MGARPTGTVTFLFTDIEGSTRLWEERPDDMRAALAEHDALLRSAIDTHGGHVFSTGGDGFAAAFQRAADAFAAAEAAQAALAGHPLLKVRMGIHTGEVQERDGDYFGPAVNRTARIMAAGHGGQTLVSDITAQLVPAGTHLRDLGEHRLRDLALPVHLWQLGTHGFPPLRAVETWRTNLPTQVTSFVGRDGAVDDIIGLLSTHRLVTLCGVAGIGKTRLALHTAVAVADRYPGGAWLVELAPSRNADDVAMAIAAVWEVQPRGGMSVVDTVREAARHRNSLLVLDNCEHIIDAAATLADLLVRDGATTVLATSREPLGVSGEQVQRVRSLESDAAIGLFVERARAVSDDFDPAPAEREQIAAICERLDGIPLAIELAAARVRALSLDDIESRLSQRFRLLAGGRRTAVERHRTMRAAVEWSHDLLSFDEQRALHHLAVCSGGFTLRAAAALLDGVVSDDPTDVVTALVDKSLVAVARTGSGSSRYTMLETIRQFAIEQLEAAGAADEARHTHTVWVEGEMRAAAERLRSPHSREAAATIAAELDNLRASVEWCVDAGEMALAVQIVGAFTPAILFNTGIEHAISVVAESLYPKTDDPFVAVLTAYGRGHRGQHTAATEALDQAQAHCHDRAALSSALQTEMTLYANQGAIDRAFEAARRRFELHDDGSESFERLDSITDLINIGILAGQMPPPEVRRHALELARRIAEPRLLVQVLAAQMMHAVARRDPISRDLAAEAVKLSEHSGLFMSSSAATLAAAAHDEFASVAARRIAKQIRYLQQWHTTGHARYVVHLAASILAQRDRPAAATLMAHLAESTIEVGSLAFMLDLRGYDDEASYPAEHAAGRALDVDGALALALRELESLDAAEGAPHKRGAS